MNIWLLNSVQFHTICMLEFLDLLVWSINFSCLFLLDWWFWLLLCCSNAVFFVLTWEDLGRFKLQVSRSLAPAWLMLRLNSTRWVESWQWPLVYLAARFDLEVRLADLLCLLGSMLMNRVLGSGLWCGDCWWWLHALHLGDFGTNTWRAVLALCGDLVHQCHYFILKCVQWACELRRLRLVKSFAHA